MEQSPYLEANCLSASQEIPRFYATRSQERATGPYPEPDE